MFSYTAKNIIIMSGAGISTCKSTFSTFCTLIMNSEVILEGVPQYYCTGGLAMPKIVHMM